MTPSAAKPSDGAAVAVPADALINVAAHLPEMARRHPEKRAIVHRTGRDADGRAV